MASGQIKKGFFFYFGMFTLLLVTVFLICLVIMIFNPGQTILWMKYFTGNETYQITKTTDDVPQVINWDNVTDIIISAPNYAKVTVQSNKQTNVAGSKKADTGIYIKNAAKGFQGASGAVSFGYDVTLNDGKLKITLREPNGFLFFSKNIEVVVHSSALEHQSTLQNKNFVILGGAGDVTIGKYLNATSQNVVLKTLYVSTTSGNVSLASNCDTYSALSGTISSEETGKTGLTPLYIKTGSGNIGASERAFSSNTDVGLKVNAKSTFKTDSGHIRLGKVDAGTNEMYIECKTGTVVNSSIKAKTVSVKCTHGNYDIQKVEGDLSFAEALESIISPNINVGEITGHFAIGNLTTSSSPDVKINKVGGNVTAHCSNGTLTIDEIGGEVDIVSDKMAVNVGLSENNTSRVSIKNGTASTKLAIRGVVGSSRSGTDNDKILIRTHSSFTLNFTKDAQFRAGTYKYNSNEPKENKGDRLDGNSPIIRMNGYEWSTSKSDFQRNYTGTENITIVTGATGNGSVVFNLVDKI